MKYDYFGDIATEVRSMFRSLLAWENGSIRDDKLLEELSEDVESLKKTIKYQKERWRKDYGNESYDSLKGITS